jgi:hypothetical protein
MIYPRQMRVNSLKKWFSPQILILLLLIIFFTPMCGLMFRCNCKQLWQGAHRQCNYFQVGMPHCPFCSAGFLVIPLILSYAPAAFGVTFIQKRYGHSYRRDLLIGTLLTTVSFAVLGWIYGRITGYPYFF